MTANINLHGFDCKIFISSPNSPLYPSACLSLNLYSLLLTSTPSPNRVPLPAYFIFPPHPSLSISLSLSQSLFSPSDFNSLPPSCPSTCLLHFPSSFLSNSYLPIPTYLTLCFPFLLLNLNPPLYLNLYLYHCLYILSNNSTQYMSA